MTRIGIDVLDVARFERLLRRHWRLTFEVFTDGERSFCDRSRNPGPRYAARFCAKEAAFKALQANWLQGEVGWQDVEVWNDVRGIPHLRLTGSARQRANDLRLPEPAVSLSHERGVAVAVVAFGADRRVAFDGESS